MERELRSRGIIRIPGTLELLIIFLEYAWALVVVLNGNSVYNASAIKDHHLIELCFLLTLALLLVNWFSGRIRLVTRDAIVAVAMVLYSVVYISARHAVMSVMDYAMLFTFCLPTVYLLFTGLQKQGILMDLIHKIVDVVVVLALISLFYWVFGVIMGLIRPNMVTYINWGYSRCIIGYDGLHFQTQLDTTFMREAFLYRNSGIFAEAPMFNLWLDIALAIELFLHHKPSRAKVVVLAVTVITTISVTGVLFLALCVVLWMSQSYRRQSVTYKRLIVAGVILVVIPVVVLMVVYSLLMKSETRSYDMRLSDYMAGLQLWWDHPIFGGGYANLRALAQYNDTSNGVVGFSNSIAAVLGTGGLWMSIVFCVPLFGTLSKRWTRSGRVSCCGTCFLLLFCTTAFSARFIAVLMIALELTFLQYPQGRDAGEGRI
ncbi:MAG: O-antigen ligase family protein [Oscillospiraceae bacterium]|nr:O-antigen ligase family protein [Oscillospiraceae bacterium]